MSVLLTGWGSLSGVHSEVCVCCVCRLLQMKGAIAKELALANLQNIPITTTKIIQLYETKNSRHSTMIVGQSGSGKSVTWRILRNVLTRLKKELKDSPYQAVKDYPINPKSLSLGELYGEFDLATNEWTDGVLSSVMRQTCAGEGVRV